MRKDWQIVLFMNKFRTVDYSDSEINKIYNMIKINNIVYFIASRI